jgi:3-oxoacyl-[acyl-carrier-protein] synthase-3
MTARIRDALQSGKHKVLMSGFGIGLSWGSCIVDIDRAVFPALVES